METNANNTTTTEQQTTEEKKEDIHDAIISSKVAFFDIETVPQWGIYLDPQHNEVLKNVPARFKKLWIDRYAANNEPSKMGTIAEFGKVVCISVGYFAADGTKKIKAIVHSSEKDILAEFADIIAKFDKVVGHNAIGFDAPFLEKRYIINGMKVPKLLQGSSEDKGLWKATKPRECKVEDTMQLWKGIGGISSGLDTICCALGLPSPKDTMTGAEVGPFYWGTRDSDMKDIFVDKISQYCNADVSAAMDIYKRILSSYL